ncbi:MAG TPA: PD-(D/E)XK nuclease family protein [Anaeromyxobacter sp.]
MSEQPFLPFDEDARPAAPSVRITPEPREDPPFLPPSSDDAPPPASERPLSRLLEELAAVCAAHPLDEKVLLAPSLLVGHTLVERLARARGPVVHLRVETLRTLAHAVAGPALAREGARLLSRAQALALLEQACGENLTGGTYFGALADRPGFHRAIQSALEELRAAGVSPGSLPEKAFADPRKPRELERVLATYAAALARDRWVDRAELMRRATELARPRTDGPLYLVPEGLDLSPVERRFAEALAGDRRIVLAGDSAGEWAERARGSRIFRASGEENEIRAVFREVLSKGIPFDEVEVLHTDPATYPALAFELASEHGIPATFSGGIAAPFTLPGQAALAFLRWIELGYEAEALREALAGGILTFPREMASRAGPLAAAREMRRAGIGWGRERHLSALDRLAAEIAYRRPRSDEDDDEEARLARRERRLRAVDAARKFAARGLSLAPDAEEADLAAVARGARLFVAEFGRVRDELDGTAASALCGLFQEIESLPGRPVPRASAAARLAEAVRSLHVTPERPRPGRIHFADFRSGGFSGRRHTFVIGLDEKRHPGGGREDPVLSDEERRGINALSDAALPLAPDRSVENALALKACVARLRGEVAFGYAGWNLRDLANPGEVFPSPFLLEVHRLAAGEAGADYARLAAVTGEGEGFVPEAGRALDETEWWLARIGDFRGPATEAAVAAIHPWLADGLLAEAARRSPEPTPWDGVFSKPTPELDPRETGMPMSASRIKMLADCPFGYFLAHVLKLASPDEPEENATEWLDKRTIGSLIHRVFRRFLEDLSRSGRRPAFPADLAALEAVADEELGAMRRRVPPRSELAYARSRDDVRFACRTFLISEAARPDDAEPVAFEVSFGIPAPPDDDSPPEFPDPVEIALRGGRVLRLRGSIDRVDRDGAGRYHVWDYKTGASMYTHEELGIDAGRQIQPALYALAWESLAARRGSAASGADAPPARVARSGYFFPGRRGLGERFAIAYSAEEARETLDALFDLVAAGAFPHSPDKDSDCFVCRDLTAFCPDREEAGKKSRAKLEKASAPALAAWRHLRG